jgi:hypothetical protein
MHPTLHHLHIHKAAGTSFARFLIEHFDDAEVCAWRFEHQASAAEEARRCRLFTGHISIPAMKAVAPDARLVTILRDPRERLLSAYGHWRRMAAANRDTLEPGRGFLGRFLGLSLDDFLGPDQPVMRLITDNAMARLLAGGRFGTTRATRAQVIGPDLDPDAIFERALETLEGAVFFGFADRLDEAQAILAGLLDWRFRPAHCLNAAPVVALLSGLSEQSRSLLDACTAIDQRVFVAAREHYATRFMPDLQP